MKSDRVPSLPRWVCPGCGYDLYTRMSPVDDAEHRVTHREAAHTLYRVRHATIPYRELEELVDLYRALDRARVANTHDIKAPLSRRICDLEESLAAANWDLEVANELVEDLRADLQTIQRQEAP